MPATPNRPSALNFVTGRMLQHDLLTPASPVTPSSSTAMTLNTKDYNTPFDLSAPPTPTFGSSGSGVLVRMSDGNLAVRTVRKTLRIDESKGGSDESKDKGQELVEGTEVDFKTDGTKAFEVKRRVV